MYNQVEVILKSDILPQRTLYVDRDTNFMELSNRVLDDIYTSKHNINICLSSILGCFYKLDTVPRKPIMLYEGYYYDNVKRLTDSVGRLANDDILYCRIFEANEQDLDEYEIKLDRDILKYQKDHIAINIYNYYDDYAIVNNRESDFYKPIIKKSSKKYIKGYYYRWK